MSYLDHVASDTGAWRHDSAQTSVMHDKITNYNTDQSSIKVMVHSISNQLFI